ncbi:sugar transferase [Listeria grandensis]|uniref:Undecaprenyl-phosphate galactosephosphotransferase n=2 Tax=Listeria grandensis TaxID=1494963 RepID=W7AZR1_9LIST|nr:sugar transferase [Listeria grandensis]EUJ18715.1 undecaprenyl-phosphate galactosephosphotransferase [Listeria grandensis FSL F6-0971]MBC1474303.1 sugar transferase [Listeria grandensis]MBC1936309.1 sugar transferase [Listeria grandensis]MBC6316936.1 sugar transferase [Listeria grandensis]
MESIKSVAKSTKTTTKFYPIVKRAMDVLGASVGLLLLTPFFIVLALIIKLSDLNAPVFFKQERVGKNGKRFMMYKFRTMIPNAEAKLAELLQFNEVEGAMFKMKHDPRITKLGGFLRKTSIDELPQLLNVLKGDMSLVGPRPPLEREVAEYSVRDYRRLSITPGCTGLWQVSGRNDVSFAEMVNLDLEYIQKVSFALDMQILLRTVRVIFVPNSAY